jgi:hypothetical protein
MKTDLVERLRRQYREQGTNYVQEAADAIEQLVAERNTWEKRACDYGWPDCGELEAVREERDALRAEVEGWMKDNSPGGWIYELRVNQSQNRIDAERWRWAKVFVSGDDNPEANARTMKLAAIYMLGIKDVDAAIDAAMGAKP